MSRIIPHSESIRNQIRDYLKDFELLALANCKFLEQSGAFNGIYKVTLAGDSFFAKLRSTERPRLSAARSLVQRVPILLACGQDDAAEITLRKLIETVFLCIYFTDHPIEWAEFERNPGAAISREVTSPISYSAHREPSFYANYAKELFAREPSGLGVAAAERLAVSYGNFSQTVHAASASVRKRVSEAFGKFEEPLLHNFSERYKHCVGDAAIVLAARFRNKFDRLPPVHRAWFDWLVGTPRRTVIRSGPFGL